MDEDTETRGPRARLTCTHCHRRKIKCNKNIPCDTCIKRREEITAAHGAPSSPTSRSSAHSETGDALRALLERVTQLEARLQQSTQCIVRQEDDSTSVSGALGAQLATPETGQPDGLESGSEPGPAGSIAADDLDAATVLEFLAWGRKKDSDFINAPEHDHGPGLPTTGFSSESNSLTENSRSAQLDVLEALLPDKSHVFQLCDFHNSSILWYHGSYSAKIFSRDLEVFFTEYGGNVRYEQLNLQWLALLFSVLTGSMTCASPSTYSSWGFSAAEQSTLSSRWYTATVTCLNLACYTETHTIYSVQAIATLTISAHILGHSNSQSILLAAAGRVAQSLGLHRLEADTSGETRPIDQLRKSEAGKRVFIQLCTQDWFSIPFSEIYSISPRFISSHIRPLNCNDDDMEVHPETMPTQASYCNYRFDIASLMPQLLDAMAGCNTMYTRYEQVLKFDDIMRKLVTASMPTFLSSNAPVAAEWPAYVSRARRSLTICASHKIIMIHRKFIGPSFTTSAFAFTRRTCLAAAKTILREAFVAVDETDPILWIDQAFSVAAAIILSLDMLHRSPADKEFGEHKQLVADTVLYLGKFEHNKIAMRGRQLLSFLQQEISKSSAAQSRKRTYGDRRGSHSSSSRKRARGFNMQSFIRDASRSVGVTPSTIVSLSTPTPSTEEKSQDWDALFDPLPAQIGFDSQYLFDNFFTGPLGPS
ncbi:uncharacterized protein E0L32_012377 [Thyridium curvatum]|uniref:Zn(2)-C6 fungal-type domain-containing protein n=1 Tax=Thyridium curvatum TaxID=1093900 RepID=A0A507BAA3_9PEZI|nr:uncharacterized protein E0L32_012377 [Thyridium curvatum]TPX16787.1 hypothetical protein E0L32_012377 [Thyridium curvatum]